MSNTLSDLTPYLYSAAQDVSKEPVGVLDGINMTFDNKGVAVGDYVYVPVAPTAAVAAFTAAATTSAGTDKIADSLGVTISASNKTSWHLTGEQKRSLENSETDKEWVRQLIAQGMRSLRNAAEAAACLIVKAGASRAVGTAAATPFASDLSALTAVRKLLRTNGCPMTDMQCVVDPNAYLNLTNLGIIQQAAMAGSDAERRSGIVGRQFGFQFRETSGIVAHTAGTPVGTQFSATEPIGETSLAYDTDTDGPWTAGDIVTFGSGGGSGTADTNKYVVNAASTATPLYINRPGLILAHVDNDTMTVGAAYTPNFAFERNSVVGVMRPPIIDANPTIKQMPISDDSGLTYLLLEIAQYGMTSWELHLAYGFRAVQPEHIALILG